MTDWYASSAAYAAIPAFTPSVAYSVGQIVKPTAPAANTRGAYRCTTAGTASTEPSWNTSNNATTITGGATFTCVTGQSAYFWGAAGGDMGSVTGDGGGARAQGGDRVFVSSDHSESGGAKTYFENFGNLGWTSGNVQVLSVNRAGSTPPVAADLTPGATFISSGTIIIDPALLIFLDGLNFQSNGGSINFNNVYTLPCYLKNCALWLNNTGGNHISAQSNTRITLDNTTVQFGAVGQSINGQSTGILEIVWINTPAAVQGATIPTNLFTSGGAPLLATCRGVDLSAVTTALAAAVSAGVKLLLDSCKIASGVVRLSGAPSAPNDVVELVNCFDGTNIVNERDVAGGAITTERTITLSGGATDDVGTFSHKMISTTRVDKYVLPLEDFWFDVENQSVGVSHTATVEIVSSGSLKNDDISLLLEYQGTSGSPVASFANSLPTTPLTANVALPTSAAVWNSSPATPVYQKMQMAFTPQKSGRVRGLVRLGKPSTTVYVNPQVTIT